MTIQMTCHSSVAKEKDAESHDWASCDEKMMKECLCGRGNLPTATPRPYITQVG